MLLELESLIREFDLKINGVIHVGMHEMEELSVYKKCGIKNRIWIEANKELCDKHKHSEEIIINEVISNTYELIDFYITTRTASDSILRPHMNAKFRKDIKVIKKEKRLAKPLRTFNFQPKYNMLNLDIQGAELKALQGADLSKIDYIYTEVNIQDMYYNVPKINDIDDYLTDYERAATRIHKKKFGDALYIKKRK